MIMFRIGCWSINGQRRLTVTASTSCSTRALISFSYLPKKILKCIDYDSQYHLLTKIGSIKSVLLTSSTTSRRKMTSSLIETRLRSLSTTTVSQKTNETTTSTSTTSTTTHFGYEQIPINEKEEMVREVFDTVATSYDIMNDVMSFGIHRLWKDYFVYTTKIDSIIKLLHHQKQMQLVLASHNNTQEEPFRILDVAGGTGDIAFRFIDSTNKIVSQGQQQSTNVNVSSSNLLLDVTVCDINNEMLKVGEQRARDRYGNSTNVLLLNNDNKQQTTQASVPSASSTTTTTIQFQQGNAEQLSQYDDNTFDLYTIAFGLRNVTNINNAIKEAYRVLKPGGRLMCLEFSHGIPNPLFRTIYDTYSFYIIPAMGDYIANDRRSYQYLVESIRQFPQQQELCTKLQQIGQFHNVTYTNLSGGIVAIHEGWKPIVVP